MNHVDSQHKNNSLPLSLLEEVYLRLGYQDGVLLDATHEPIAANKDAWVEKGGWLSLANEVGAEKILFVNNDPVFVFYKFDTEPDIQTQIDTFRRVWCMARPQCLFMAFPGELRVYNLKQAPSRNELEWKKVRPLAVVKQVADVAEELKAYRRERVESGQLFGDARFGGVDQRADKRLIQDLKTVRRSLRKEGKEGLELRYAHTLIGRSIFIRYLEDRKVLTLEYFQKIASANSDWQAVLSNVLEKPEFSEEQSEHFYTRVLKDKAFTFALFRQLTRDFNGDMFPEDEGEEAAIDQNHLTLLRQFLLGDSGSQQSLFFWAYNFEIIPIDLISSLYEEFYHEDNGDDDKGTHYTPSVLVEYVLSQVLDEKTLESRPKILDPACGSGIFLVEAFRRIVRYNVQKIGRLLTSDELRDILKNQLRGFEINGEAIRVAAFSLYLALLHYQEPSDILRSKKLPNLIYEKDENFSTYYNILFNTNTFALMSAEREELKTRLDENGKFAGRSAIEALYNSIDILPVMPNSFDVIIGNPPWGFVRGVSSEIQQAQVQAEQWSAAFGWTIGDKEPSQTFIARTFSLLKTGGVCGLLISTGIFFKHHENSREFRQSWLAKSTVEKVVNFVHVRHTFFSANSPFAFVLYHTEPAQSSHTVQYWSVKKTKFVDNVQIVILDSVDLRQVKQLDLL